MGVDLFFRDKILKYFDHTPTESQSQLFNTLSNFILNNPGDNILVINGYAGTGKTSAIAAFVKAMKGFNMKYRLLAPTGRSAKVLANYTGESSHTIHKQIYRQKSMDAGMGIFTLDHNKDVETVYIVDESSLISVEASSSIFGSGDVLDDLVQYVKEGRGNKLILVGDDAQLPPIGLEKSPALDIDYLSKYGPLLHHDLFEVVRQTKESGILFNATIIRHAIENQSISSFPHLTVKGFKDVHSISGGELLEALSNSIDKYGLDETVVLCRSNKRANRYNAGIRSTILYREEKLTRTDKLMVVKNCYHFVEDVKELDFIANGDVAELIKIGKYEERYGLHFAQAVLSFPDYNNIEIEAKVILDTLDSESASLSSEQQKTLYEGVFSDYDNIHQKRKRNAAVREDPYYNALQIKYATAITCHKSQGGQWSSVFIDNAFWRDDITLDDLKWLYTAITRSTSQVYFVNFNKKFFE